MPRRDGTAGGWAARVPARYRLAPALSRLPATRLPVSVTGSGTAEGTRPLLLGVTAGSAHPGCCAPPSTFVTTHSSPREGPDTALLLRGGQSIHPELASPPPGPEQRVPHPWCGADTWRVLGTC